MLQDKGQDRETTLREDFDFLLEKRQEERPWGSGSLASISPSLFQAPVCLKTLPRRDKPPEGREPTWDENDGFLLLAKQGVDHRAGRVPHRAVPDDHGRGDHEEAFCVHRVSLLQHRHDRTVRVPPYHVGLRVPSSGRAFQPHASILLALHFNERLRAQAWGQRPGSS